MDIAYALKQHAYIVSQCTLALARIKGMESENLSAARNGFAPPYGEEQFEREMKCFFIDPNSVIGAFL